MLLLVSNPRLESTARQVNDTLRRAINNLQPARVASSHERKRDNGNKGAVFSGRKRERRPITVPGMMCSRNFTARATPTEMQIMIPRPGAALLASDSGSAPAEQIEDQHYYCDDDQQVNQVAADAAD